METDDPIAVVIAALHSFEPSHDDTDNLHRLYQLFVDFRSSPDRHRAAPAMFSLLERFPDAEFGSPGPLVHELEAIPGYLPLLRGSVRRQPTYHTVWMVSRLLNTKLPSDQESPGSQSYAQRLNTLLLQSGRADLRKIFWIIKGANSDA